jgi:membrane peptidoglycan carboxypeptidase
VSNGNAPHLTQGSKKRSVNPFQVLGLLIAFFVLAVIGGVLAAALVVPLAAGASTATEVASDTFYEIPSELEIDEPSQVTKIYASNGKTLLASYYAENRKVVPLDEISLHMQNAVVATEDKRFWTHGGVDLQGISRAAMQQLQGDGGGGSTLTQQYVKNVLIHKASRAGDAAGVQAARAGSLERKMKEAKLALHLEKTLSKEQILENYLNIAQFGTKVYGVETAANYYFGKNAKDLDIVEAATIAGITQLPGKYDPTKNPTENERRRNIVLMLMFQQGYIDREQYDEAIATKVEDTLNVKEIPNGCESAGRNGFFCDYVTKTIMQDPAFGETEKERSELLYRGGLTIITTLDVKLQKEAYITLRDRIPAKNEEMIATALTAIEPGTGKILVMTQNRTYNPSSTKKKGTTSVNYSAGPDYGGSQGFQVGSTFKTFVLAEWLRTGHTLNNMVDATKKTWRMNQFKASCTGFSTATWSPNNSDGLGSGRRSALQATATSINTAYVSMLSELDLCDVAKMAEKAGFEPTARVHNGEVKVQPSMVLGTQESSPLSMANAYATFAAGGTYCEPIAITKITDANGKELPVPDAQCRQTIDSATVNGVNYALSRVIAPGGGAPQAALAGGRPAAGKTGTTNNNTDAWFVGYTPHISTAIWMGQPDDRSVYLQNIRINGQWYSRVYGSTLAAPMWKQFMDFAHEDKPKTSFDPIALAQLGEREKSDAEIKKEEEAKKKKEEEEAKKKEQAARAENDNDRSSDSRRDRRRGN